MSNWIEQTINDLGYIGLTLLMFLENIFPPIPSELVMPLGGFLSTRQLTFVGVVLAGTAGSVLGAYPLYLLGYYLSTDRLKDLADKYGTWLSLDSDDIDDAMQWFDNHGRATIFFCRMVPGVRSLISIPAGTYQMNLLAFTLFTALGSAVWSALLAYGGRLLGQNYQQMGQYLAPLSYITVGAIIIFVLWRIIKD